MIKNFSSADVYFLSGVILCSFEHTGCGAFLIIFSVLDAIACVAKERAIKEPS